jgi:hypothetical protein
MDVESAGLDVLRTPEVLSGAIVVALPSNSERVEKSLPKGTEFLTLKVRSVPMSLSQWMPARPELLIGVASRWPRFLKLARTMLIAAGFQSDALVIRDARKAGWQRSLNGTVAVVCDCVSAQQLPPTSRAITYPLLSDAAIADLKRLAGFVTGPLD